MLKVELLAPAGDLEKLKTAFLYGADACYIGGKNFSLRSKANNFSLKDINEAIYIKKKINKKIYLTINVFVDNNEIKNLVEYLNNISQLDIDGLIVSDPGVIYLIKKYNIKIPLHISTQANTQNWCSVKFWEKCGAKRVVLGREVKFDNILDIKNKTRIELEIFIHGSMCMAYSGRCMLSMYLSEKSANKGDCKNPCRWKYFLMESKRIGEYLPIEEDDKGTYILNSKDLCALPHIKKFIDIGINNFKIEGRMKSIHYVASVVNIYRKAIDTILFDIKNKKNNFYNILPELMKELINIGEREYNTDFYFDKKNLNMQQYKHLKIKKNIKFVAVVIDEYKDGFIKIEQRNKFTKDDCLEVLSPYE